jgi:syntaxin of plants SYP5
MVEMVKVIKHMKEQDEILEVMSKGLDNLKNMGSTIKDEADLHLRLLDDIEDQVEKGDANLKRETARTSFITKQSSTCWLYTTICILLAVLIALIVIRWA